MTIITLANALLTAAAEFCAAPGTPRAVLTEVLLEVTPDAVRLVATDTYGLLVLHLPVDAAHDVTVEGPPVALTVPVREVLPLLKHRKSPRVTLTMDPAAGEITVCNAAGMQATVPGRPAAEFVPYRTLLAGADAVPRAAITLDAALLARWVGVARALGVPPRLTLAFRPGLGPVEIQLPQAEVCYGLLMPVAVPDAEHSRPAWADDAVPAQPVAA